MTPELKARIAEDGLFRTTRLMQLEKRAAMPPSSTFYHPRRTSGVSWIEPLEPKPVVEIVKPLACATIDSEELDLEDTEPTPLEGEVMAPVIVQAGVEESDPTEMDESESGDSDGEEQDGGYAEVHEE